MINKEAVDNGRLIKVNSKWNHRTINTSHLLKLLRLQSDIHYFVKVKLFFSLSSESYVPNSNASEDIFVHSD